MEVGGYNREPFVFKDGWWERCRTGIGKKLPVRIKHRHTWSSKPAAGPRSSRLRQISELRAQQKDPKGTDPGIHTLVELLELGLCHLQHLLILRSRYLVLFMGAGMRKLDAHALHRFPPLTNSSSEQHS